MMKGFNPLLPPFGPRRRRGATLTKQDVREILAVVFVVLYAPAILVYAAIFLCWWLG